MIILYKSSELVLLCTHTLNKYNIGQKCLTVNNLKPCCQTSDRYNTHIYSLIYKCAVCTFVYKWPLYISV